MKKSASIITAAALAAGTVLLATGGVANAATPSVAKTYASCTALNQKFPYGVRKAPGLVNRHTADKSKPLAQRRVVDRKKRPVAAGIYRKNISLDFDKDGIACER